jgi:hypothetical protein
MNLNRSLTLTLLLTICTSTSCSKDTVQPASSSTGALTANSALNNLPARPFARHVLNASGFHFLNEFIRPEVRSRIDEEPVGDSDGTYDPSTLGPEISGGEGQSESSEGQTEEVQQDAVSTEESNPTGSTDSLKFGWAKKAFGDALKASPASSGVIVLYADENYFDINRLMAFVEDGRNRIAERSAIGGDRIQVVFGGYRGAPQLELWVVPNGSMPELKPEDRSKSSGPEN